MRQATRSAALMRSPHGRHDAISPRSGSQTIINFPVNIKAAENSMILPRYDSTRLALATVTLIALAAVISIYGFDPLLSAFRQIEIGSIGLAVLALLANYGFALLRFRSVIGRLGYPLKLPTALAGFAVGQLSNAFVLNIVGQSLGRAAVLSRDGVAVDAAVIGTYIERLIAMGALGLLAILGAVWLFGGLGFQFTGGTAYLLAALGSVAFASLAVWRFGLRGSPEWAAALDALPPLSLAWPALAYTVLGQIAMGLAYWFLLPVPTSATTLDVAAAIAVVMFLASIPISFAGWGIRELSAAKALGLIGIAPPLAVAAAMLVGLLSLVIPLLNTAALAVLARRIADSPPAAEMNAADASHLKGARSLMLLIAISTAILIGFQVRVPMEGYQTTVNLGDAGALTSLGLAIYLALRNWPVPILDRAVVVGLACLSGLVAAALVIGLARYGFIEWAWLNRGMGWAIVLGYVSIGPGTLLVAGDGGRDRVLHAFFIGLASIAVVQVALYFMAASGGRVPNYFNAIHLEGFALNRNAYSFQLSMSLIVVWAAMAQAIERSESLLRWTAGAAILLAANFLTFSRTGFICAAALLVLAPALAPPHARWRLAKASATSAVCAAALSWRASASPRSIARQSITLLIVGI